MTITYSLLGAKHCLSTAGIGLGLTYVPCTTIVNFYFEKRRSFANGVVVSASGVGGFAFPYLYRFLFDKYGLRGGLLILGGFMMNMCIFASLLRQPFRLSTITDVYKNEKQQESEYSQKRKPSILIETDETPTEDKIPETYSNSAMQWFRNVFNNVFKFDWKLLQNIRLDLFILAFSFAMLGYGSVFYMLPAQMHVNGQGKQVIVFALSLLGICEVFSRIIVGMIVDAKIISPHMIFSFSMLISGISMVLVPYMTALMHFCIFAVIVGIFPGSMFTVLPAIIIEDRGLNNLPAVFGLVFFFSAVLNVLGHPLSGWLKDIIRKFKENKETTEIKDIEEKEMMLITDK
ncbi:hypothetical protein KUTeg_013795 [Tegillarca granosa]|uniref:Uncharacterized protein n=1 Tax=Tegillarca granosa TaxID=220873 RepID=A0ABQ9EY87_TEGGR|nr:hypothetical protein KUTeg_013795 [Tegillarca granosa]